MKAYHDVTATFGDLKELEDVNLDGLQRLIDSSGVDNTLVSSFKTDVVKKRKKNESDDEEEEEEDMEEDDDDDMEKEDDVYEEQDGTAIRKMSYC